MEEQEILSFCRLWIGMDMVPRAYIDFSVVGKRSKGLVEGSFHLFRCAFEEPPATAVEESIAREDGLVFAVLHEPTNAVLRVARCV